MASGSRSREGEHRIGVILNPTAGSGRALTQLPRIVATLSRLRCPHHVHVTTAPGEATSVARVFADRGYHLVIAVGGDGTVNEVANGLLDDGSNTALGVLPAGRGSDFARSTGRGDGTELTLERLIGGRRRGVDIGRATFDDGSSRAFVNVAGLGFDAVVAQRAAQSRLPGTTLAYLASVGASLAQYRNIEVSVVADGCCLTGLVCSVLTANGRYFGGGMLIAPMADPEDGLLDLAILGDLSKADLLRNMPKVYRGTHLGHPKFTTAKVRSIRVEGPPSQPALVQLDGEVVGRTPVTFTVEPRRLVLAG